MKKYAGSLMLCLAAVMLTGCAAASQLFGTPEEVRVITVAFTGSLHGDVNQAAAAVREMKDQQEHAAAIDLGGLTAGSMTSYFCTHVDTSGQHVQSRLMRYIGYDAAVLGGRDMGMGTSAYQRIRQESGTPWIGANVISRSTGEPHESPYRIIRNGGTVIAVLGLTHPAGSSGIPERVIPGVRVQDMQTAAERWTAHIREQENPDIIIGAVYAADDFLFRHTAQTFSESDLIDYRDQVLSLVRNTSGFDLVVSNFGTEPQTVSVRDQEGREVPVVTIGSLGTHVLFCDIELVRQRGELPFTLRSITPNIRNLQEYEADTQAANILESYAPRVEQYALRRAGALEEDLLSREGYFYDAPMTSLLHTVQLAMTNAHVSFASVPARNAVLSAGDVTAGDLFSLMPHESFVFSVRMTGHEIREYLEYSYSRWFSVMRGPYDNLIRFRDDGTPEVPYFQYDSAGGIRYTVDVTRPPGQRVEILEFTNGRPFRLQDTYIAALNSYRISGGGGHLTEGAKISLNDIPSRIVSAGVRDLRHNIIRWFETNQVFPVMHERSWFPVPESWGAAGRLNDYPRLFEESPFE